MAPSVSSPSPYVLVVEDEPLIRLDAVDLIEYAGFNVIEATNADQAFEILSARGDIVIVFTDIDMPGSMDGLKLATIVRNRWPPIEILITSGKFKPPQESLPDRSRFLAKPYSGDRLIDALRKLAA